MVLDVFGLGSNNNRSFCDLFVFLFTFLFLSSCCIAAVLPRNSVPGRIEALYPENKEPPASNLGTGAHSPSPKRFPAGLVTKQKYDLVNSTPRKSRAREHKIGGLVEVDGSGRHGRQIGEEDQIVGSSQARQEYEEQHLTEVREVQENAFTFRTAEGGDRMFLMSEKNCVKLIRGQQRGLHQSTPAFYSVLRAVRSTTPSKNANPEVQVLQAWMASLTSGPKNVFANWNLALETNICLWRGVECHNLSEQAHVVSINLAGYKISGSLSSGLGGLPFLTTLDLSYNRLSGPIPGDLTNIPSLQTVNFSFNRLNGSIPSFGNASLSLQSLNLFRNKLEGAIPPSLGQCKQLVDLNLAHNRLGGDIPSELGTLPNLQELILSQNDLSGNLPQSLGSCTSLVNMSLGGNLLAGEIPDEYSNLQALQGLYLDNNNLTGKLPLWLVDLPRLLYLHLYENEFNGEIPSMLGRSQQLRSLVLSNNSLVGTIPGALVESLSLFEIDLSWNQLNGSIPAVFGYLTQLQRLALEQNLLTGSIPDSLANCVQLEEIDFAGNKLDGPIPRLDTFLYLQRFCVHDNHLMGTIPGSVTKCVNLTVLDLSNNYLNGPIPGDIGQLNKLARLGLSGNQLEGILPPLAGLVDLESLNLENNLLNGSIPGDIEQMTNLISLGFAGNSFGGVLPEFGGLFSIESMTLDHNLLSGPIPATLGRLSQLQVLTLGSNNFVGAIPQELSRCVSLTTLTLDNNSLNGSIPNFLGQLRSLRVLHLQGNKLSGLIPPSFNNLTMLQDLDMSENELRGGIPLPLLSILSELQGNFSLANNRMSGPLPPELGMLTMVQSLNLSGNSFSGFIPDEIGNCTQLRRLDLAENDLKGLIPSSIGKLLSLQLLNLSHNALSDSIPAAVGALVQLVQLDLSANNLSGDIPVTLSNLSSLVFLNVSDNILQGPVPQDGPFQNFSASSFWGNSGLCGPVLEIRCGVSAPFSERNSRKRSLSTAALVGLSVGIFGFVALVVVAAGLLVWRLAPLGKAPRQRGSIIARSELFYPQLRFTVQDLKLATENFSDVNILGAGSLSNVYRGVLPELVLVAVKKLKVANETEISPGFFQGLDELGRLRHRHLVAILGHCFDTEMNALVVQFMSNGSLEEHLHRGEKCDLDWPARVKVGIGVAKALTYLHHDCSSTIVHCDLKPSNVLLDAEFEAHLEDFGLSRLIFSHRLMDMTNSSVGSSIGYFPPEYGYSPTVSSKGDVYSYGILLLELITGKKPTMDMFKDDMSLTTWCEDSFPNKLLEVLDPTLIGLKETNQKQVNLFMKVALMCAKRVPENRPTMRSVLDMLR